MSTPYEFQINEKLHQSPHFIFYRGILENTEQSILLKIPNTDFPKKTLDERAEREFAISKNLEHPNIINYLKIEQSPSGKTIIMEDFNGVPLSSFLASGKINLHIFLSISTQMADVISFLHQSEFIHKDLQLDSFWINPEDFKIKLIDWGQTTKIAKEKQQLVNPELLDGELEFISPEQTGRMNRTIDYRTDLYSLGVIFYRMLSGNALFQAQSPLEYIHAHIAQKPTPLHEVDKDIPEILSKIVSKLLSKNAEDRYQSASGLLNDLVFCQNSDTDIFSLQTEIAQQDFSGKLQIPQKLYGRDSQIKSLLHVFDQIQFGGLELMLIDGYAGVGKTSLVYEIHRPVTLTKGYFTEGKADQLMKSIPYLPWIQALTNLVDQLLAEEESQLATWVNRVQKAVGENGKVLTDVIPNLTSLIGEQPEVPSLQPTQAQNRFNYVFRQFTHALTADEHPLVLFLDDMQWADAASLNLVKTLLVEDEVENLLVILSYRSNEVNAAHPLLLTLEEVYKSTVSYQKITAENLTEDEVAQLISDTLNTDKKEVLELTNLIFEKTNGNAFFVKEFLKSLYENGHLKFSFGEKKWQWNVKTIQELDITNNVVELLENDIQKLSHDTLEILKMAACIGNRFDEKTLTIISEIDYSEIQEALEKARIKGYIEKIGLDEYKFTHDKIHQTFYKLIPESKKQDTHVRVGQLLYKSSVEKNLEQQLFTIANHWNTGLDKVQDLTEQQQLFDLNLHAAKKAKSSNAYQAAGSYLQVATQLSERLKLAPENPNWFTLHKERAEISYLLTDYQESEKIIESTLENAKELNQEMDLYKMLILQYTMTSNFAEAIEVGRTSLKKLGVDIPLEGLGDLIGQEIGAAFGQLGTRSVNELLEIPNMTDEKQILTTRILASMLSPSFFANQELFALIVTKIVNISMKHGNVPASCFGYGCFGLILSTVANYEKGFEFGEMAYNLAKQFNDPTEQGRACFHLSEFTSLWTKPFKYSRQHNREGFLHALDAGDLQYAGYLSIYDSFYPSYQEKDIASVLEAMEESLSFNKKTQNVISLDTVQGLKIAMSCLGGLTKDSDNFDLEDLTEAKYLEDCLANKNVLAICIYHIVKAQVCYIHDNPQKALDALEEANQFLPYIAGMLFTAEHNFYGSMSMTALYETVDEEKQKEFLEKINTNQEKLKVLADSCPENWKHKYLLVAAELALLNQEHFQAIELYREAIEYANTNNFRPLKGLANERLAKLWKKKGDYTYAGLHFREALYAYEGMGAKHKITQLEEQLTKLGIVYSKQERNSLTNTKGLKTSSGSLDLESVLKASQTLSSEIVLEKLLDKMMHIVMENAGAEKGYLMNEVNGEFFIQAERKSKGEVEVLQNISINGKHILPESIIKYVARTKENVVIQNAVEDKRFLSDDYIINEKPKSILCTSVSISGNQIAVLYLENNLLTGAFTNDRVELLQVLSSQIAISLDNALLYQTMEEKVKERTNELELQRNESEKLLLNILPEETAKELKTHGKVQPRLYESVSMMFIDIVGFTKIAERVTPELLVKELDYYYSTFDRIMYNYGIEKIKTIGDAFFAAAGVPVTMHNHANIIIKAAQEVLKFVEKEKANRSVDNRMYYEVRIGINSGSVIGGVVGHSKYSFDIWGSSVNIAARMENKSEVGKINISENTYQLIKDVFECSHRGKISAKGIGEIDMYFVE